MAIKRVVDTRFWSDDKIMEQFSPEDKYFFLYLMTNKHSSQLGIYALNKKIMAFDLGYSEDVVNVLIDRFQNKYKIIKYSDLTREVAIKNYLRYSIVKGGKPVEDLLRREIEKVQDKSLLRFVYENIIQYDDLSDAVKNIMDLLASHDTGYDTSHDTGYDTSHDTGYDTSHDTSHDTGYDTPTYRTPMNNDRMNNDNRERQYACARENSQDFSQLDEFKQQFNSFVEKYGISLDIHTGELVEMDFAKLSAAFADSKTFLQDPDRQFTKCLSWIVKSYKSIIAGKYKDRSQKPKEKTVNENDEIDWDRLGIMTL